jgi:cobalt-zinc-cadmium efflux system protein
MSSLFSVFGSHNHEHEHDSASEHDHAHEHTHAHTHGHGHDHTHGMARKTLRTAFFLTLLILAVEFAGGLLAHSLALIADAGHVLTDIFALGLAWFATAQAERPANASHTYGYHRVGILAALINAITLILVTVWILYEAWQRFQTPESVQPLAMFLAATVGIIINLYIGFGLRKDGGDNLNTRAAALHVFGDVGASFAVILAGLGILLTHWYPLDPLLSVAIAVLIALGAWRVLRETTEYLLESVPRGIDLNQLAQDMAIVPGLIAIHDLHVWGIASGMYALSCHAQIADLPPSESAPILTALENLLRDRYSIGHTAIQFESHSHDETFPQTGCCCASNSIYCQFNGSKKETEQAQVAS